MTMKRGFKAELASLPRYKQKDCRTELFRVLGLKSVAQFYRKRNGTTKLNPAEIAAVKDVIAKYRS